MENSCDSGHLPRRRKDEKLDVMMPGDDPQVPFGLAVSGASFLGVPGW